MKCILQNHRLTSNSIKYGNRFKWHRNLHSTKLRDIISSYTSIEPIEERKQICREIIVPNLDNLYSELCNSKHSIKSAMMMRGDTTDMLKILLKMDLKTEMKAEMKTDLYLMKSLDQTLQNFLSAVFSPDSIQLKRITYESSSGNILESVARGEAVHSVRSLSELKRRLHNGRRCFAYFHNSMENEPLAFIHVALTPDLAPSLSYINAYSTETNPTHAMFYSVNSPWPSLSGLDLATRLIKDAVNEVSHQFPTVQTYSTLSPIPSFMKWLETLSKNRNHIQLPFSIEKIIVDYKKKQSIEKVEAVIDGSEDSLTYLISTLKDTSWTLNTNQILALKDAILWLGCVYIAQEKLSTRNTQPLDPVARFHLRNGATFLQLNWMGNPSTNGLNTSAGMMVNYLYDMSNIQKYSDEFENSGKIEFGEQIKIIMSTK